MAAVWGGAGQALGGWAQAGLMAAGAGLLWLASYSYDMIESAGGGASSAS